MLDRLCKIMGFEKEVEDSRVLLITDRPIQNTCKKYDYKNVDGHI